MRRQLLTALLLTIVLIVLLGIVYPLVVTGVDSVAFGSAAKGSLVSSNGKVVGSRLLGQAFTGPDGRPLQRYFQPRPSDAGAGYDAGDSGGSNLGPTDPALVGFIPGINTVDVAGQSSKSNPFASPDDPYCVPVDPSGNPVTSPSPGQRYLRRGGHFVCDPDTVPERVLAYRRFNGLPPGTAVPVDAVTASGSGLDPDVSEANALDQAARVAQARNLPLASVVALVKSHTDSRPWGFLGEKTVNVLDLNLALDGLH
jgi:K+-transporting ATPase ATPase C chain